MFDWNDEELANIIWDEAGESDDHIVPYPDGSENKSPGSYGDHNKEWVKEAARLRPTATTEAVKHGCNSQYETYGGVPATGLGLWPDLSLSNSAKADKNSMGMDGTNKTTEISNYESSRTDEKTQLDEGSELCNQPKDREESDFVNYGWANIGSFDDLDRIFSNEDDPMFGHVNLGNADEPWSSSKDVTTSPEISVSLSLDSPSLGLGALESKPENFETKAEDMLDQDQPTPGFQKMNNYSCHSRLVAKDSMVNLECVGGKKQPILKDKAASEMVGTTSALNSLADSGTVVIPTDSADKVTRQRKLLKSQKNLGVKSEARKLQMFGGSWSSYGTQLQQYDTQFAPDMGQPSSPKINQQQQFHGPEFLQYKHFTNPLLTPEYAMEIQYPSMPASPLFQSGEGKHQHVPSGYEVSTSNSNPLNKRLSTPRKILNMTPQEKIEKLRRRQQIRAMLAIQKQQQQFTHQALCNDNCISPRSGNQMQLMGGGCMELDESLSILPSLDQCSPMEQNDSNTVHMNVDNCSIEESILHQLQDVITKLGIQTRLCIRDSLFRLAQSSMQRQHASDTSSTDKGSIDEVKVLAEKGTNNHKRFARMPDVETDTNPIDRTVAHLLFHRPLELSGKLPVLESPLPTNLPCERKATAVMSLPEGFFSEGYKHPSINIPCLFTVGNESKRPCPDTSENASNNETADGEAIEVKASQ